MPPPNHASPPAQPGPTLTGWRLGYALAALAVLAAELLIATRLRHWPWVRGELGDVLAVGGVFCVGMALWPRQGLRQPGCFALVAVAVGWLVELAQALQLGPRLGLPAGSVAAIVLGTTFSTRDLLMYTLGGALAWLAHHAIRAGTDPDPIRGR